MAPDRMRPEAERAAGLAAAPRIERKIRMLEITAEVMLGREIALVDRRDERELIHVFEYRPGVVVHDAAVGQPVAQAKDRFERHTLGDLETREIEFFPAHEIERLARGQRTMRIDRHLRADHADEDRAPAPLQMLAELDVALERRRTRVNDNEFVFLSDIQGRFER
ncbi:hypothetical protein NECAME_18895 [Necator americanus]|uniref:Uncharacterized protein n=1 Tax=Necator americanus TaxID=51031 RepID=W2SRL3_NECAM|nr:hypothetical protein NECAME_18895 [Necator americanus]ETN72374.1 hypothetical protein NECAME_18895 [Necator americanus]